MICKYSEYRSGNECSRTAFLINSLPLHPRTGSSIRSDSKIFLRPFAHCRNSSIKKDNSNDVGNRRKSAKCSIRVGKEVMKIIIPQNQQKITNESLAYTVSLLFHFLNNGAIPRTPKTIRGKFIIV